MLFCEIKKTFGIKYVRLLCLLLVAVDVIICFIVTSPGETYPDTAELSRFFEIYDADPEGTENTIRENAMAAFDILGGEVTGGVNVYTSTPFGDEGLLGERQIQKRYAEGFERDLKAVVRNAGINITDLRYNGVPEDSYLVRYQRKAETIYSDFAETVTAADVNTVAWESYFGNKFECIIAFVIMSAVVITAFTYESDAGTDMIIVATAKGRRRLLACKLSFIAAVSLAAAVLLSAASLGVYALRGGLASPALPLQSLPSFELCPFRITIGGYVLAQTALKAFTLTVFSLAVAAVTSLLRSHVTSYLVSLGFAAASFALSLVPYTRVESYLRCFNLCSFYSSKLIFSRLTAQNIFTYPVNALYVGLALYALLALALTCAVCGLWMSKRVKKLRRVREKKARAHTKRTQAKQHSLLYYELRKTVLSAKTLALVLAVLAVYVYLTAGTLAAPRSFDDTLLRYYMKYYAGEVTDEKLAEIDGLTADVEAAAEEYSSMKTLFDEGRISYVEYSTYVADHSDVPGKYQALLPLIERTDYLRGVRERGTVVPHFIYDTGLTKLFADKYVFLIFALVAALLAKSFPVEFVNRSSSGGFVNVLRTTKNGRGRTFLAKHTAGIIVSVTLSVTAFLASVIIYLLRFDEGLYLSAPVVSMPVFSGEGTALTVGEFLLISLAVRTAAAVILSLVTVSVSYYLGQVIPALSAVFCAAFLPLVLSSAGLDGFAAFSFYDAYSAFGYYIASLPDAGAEILLMLAASSAVSAVLTVPSYLRFARKKG